MHADALNTPFSELMTARQLSPYVRRFITFALALVDSDASAEELTELLQTPGVDGGDGDAEEKQACDEPESGEYLCHCEECF